LIDIPGLIRFSLVSGIKTTSYQRFQQKR